MSDDPLVRHVSELLALAMQKHKNAIVAVQRCPIDIPAARAAVGDLADAELLIEDVADIAATPELDTVLAQLRQQRKMLEVALARLDARPSWRSRLGL
jgi:hypothetical protein